MNKVFILGTIFLASSCAHFYQAENVDLTSKTMSVANIDTDHILKKGDIVFVYENICSKNRRATFCEDEPTAKAEVIDLNGDRAKLRLIDELKTGKISYVRHQFSEEKPTRAKIFRDRI